MAPSKSLAYKTRLSPTQSQSLSEPPNSLSRRTMADKENCVRVTRAMKRKAEAAAVVEQTPTKKRVVLGELPYLQNAAVPANEGSGVEPHKQKCRNRTRTRAKKALPIPEAAPPMAQEVDTTPLDRSSESKQVQVHEQEDVVIRAL